MAYLCCCAAGFNTPKIPESLTGGCCRGVASVYSDTVFYTLSRSPGVMEDWIDIECGLDVFDLDFISLLRRTMPCGRIDCY